jgi:hypothetical protein
MSNMPASFDDFLNEISASLSGVSGEAALSDLPPESWSKL